METILGGMFKKVGEGFNKDFDPKWLELANKQTSTSEPGNKSDRHRQTFLKEK